MAQFRLCSHHLFVDLIPLKPINVRELSRKAFHRWDCFSSCCSMSFISLTEPSRYVFNHTILDSSSVKTVSYVFLRVSLATKWSFPRLTPLKRRHQLELQIQEPVFHLEGFLVDFIKEIQELGGVQNLQMRCGFTGILVWAFLSHRGIHGGGYGECLKVEEYGEQRCKLYQKMHRKSNSRLRQQNQLIAIQSF